MSTRTREVGTETTGGRKTVGESRIVYFLLGVYLGTLFIKSEVASWFRIQEMFEFASIHMYGVIGLAVVVGAGGLALMKRFRVRTIRGEVIHYPGREEARPTPQHILGGIVFGLGWGLLGACPGPIFALVGAGIPVMLIALFGALAGAWVYGLVRPHLPH